MKLVELYLIKNGYFMDYLYYYYIQNHQGNNCYNEKIEKI